MLPIFNNPELLQRALTHSSFANENADNATFEDNERLEFLGDAILDFVSASWLFETYLHLDEGRLTSVRAALVRVGTLAEFARQINMQDVMRLGKGEVDTGGRNRSNILGDAFEALIGALYLDQGIETARAFIIPFLQRASEAILNENLDRDAKSRRRVVSGRHSRRPPARVAARVPGVRAVPAVRAVLVGSAGERRKDLDALLALGDLPAHRLPDPVAGDLGRVGALHPDRDGVAERVVVEPGRGGQPVRPRLRAAQEEHLRAEGGVELLEPVPASVLIPSRPARGRAGVGWGRVAGCGAHGLLRSGVCARVFSGRRRAGRGR